MQVDLNGKAPTYGAFAELAAGIRTPRSPQGSVTRSEAPKRPNNLEVTAGPVSFGVEVIV
jgi:hypothetical protein